MNDTRITKDRVRNHFAYSWWKYMILAVVAVFGWNLIYTATAYRAPRDKRMDVYIVAPAVGEETLNALREETLSLFPELEDASILSVMYGDSDQYYGDMQLTTYVGAGEGDIYLLPRERFLAFANSGAFVPLDEAIETGAIDLHGIDVRATTLQTEDGDSGIYGIPAAELFGLLETYNIDNRDLMVGIMAYSPQQNHQRSFAWIDWLIDTMKAPKPEWLDAREKEMGITPEPTDAEDVSSY